MAIQIIKENRLPTTGQRFNQAFSRLAESSGEAVSQQKENEQIKKQIGIDLSGIRDPQTRQALIADQLKQGRRYREAEASQKVKINRPEDREDTPYNKRDLPGFAEEFKEKPRGESGEGRPRQDRSVFKQGQGLAPEASTEGDFAELNPRQIEQEGERLSNESLYTEKPITKEEGIQQIINNEILKSNFKERRELDRQRKQQHERDYGQKSVDKLLNVLPEATDEMQASFRERGEKYAQDSKSESEFEKLVAADARKFKNDISNLENSFPPARLFSGIKSGILGNDRKAIEARNDIKVKLQPLLKDGRYDTARYVLSKIGYSPEERESLISDLSESTSKAISQLPNFQKPKLKEPKHPMSLGPVYNFTDAPRQTAETFSPEQTAQIYDSLLNIFNSDPNTNLILLRKAYEDKGVDWREFKNQINQMIFDGSIKLNDDQFNQLNSYLDDPPLGPLDKILHKVKLIGR